MKALQSDYRIGELCAAFGVSRSGYHRWRTAGASARACEDALLGEELRRLHAQSRGSYGRPRLWVALRRAGRGHSSKRIGRLMRRLGLRGVQRGRFRPQTTDSRHGLKRAPNRLLKALPPDGCDQLWVADITFVATQEGWLYLAGVLDRHSRRVLGLAFSTRIDSSLPESALRQAFARRGGNLRAGLLHHSDQGLQYASATYQALLSAKEITPSMSRKANCYDNAHMESFWATLKAELFPATGFSTRAEARLAIFEYVETFYNRVRLHSALGYLCPVEFEKLNTH
jgi:transposase InsO family protein